MTIVYGGIVFFLVYIALIYIYHETGEKISDTEVHKKTVQLEIKNNIYALIIYSGLVQLFYRLYSIGVVTFTFEITRWVLPLGILLVIFHDAYFYFLHRGIHTTYMYKNVHKDHHASHHPTIFSAYNFHPVESVLYVGAVLIVFFVTLNFYALAFAIFYNDLFNFLGHSGYEIMKKRPDTIFFKYFVLTTYHDLHHSNNKGNFGLYFSWWDRLFNTYDETYDRGISEK